MKEVKKIFDEELSKNHFVRRGENWYRKTKDLITVLNLQKSNFDTSYFLNLGIWFNEIDDNTDFPKEQNCHIRVRGERLFDINDQVELRRLLDFAKVYSNDERKEEIRFFLRNRLVPKLSEIDSVNAIRDSYKEGKISNLFIHKDAKDILERP